MPRSAPNPAYLLGEWGKDGLKNFEKRVDKPRQYLSAAVTDLNSRT